MTEENTAIDKPLDLAQFPTLPAPWSSIDEGETWVWDDIFLIFQTRPKTIYQAEMEWMDKKPEDVIISYLYAISIFQCVKNENEEFSGSPFMVVALEQSDFGLQLHQMEIDGEDGEGSSDYELGSNMGPLMFGMFRGESHFNLGEYDGDESSIVVKDILIDIIKTQLNLSGEPKLIGNFEKAWGHPETGLPSLSD